MKRTYCLLLTVLLSIALAACNAPAATTVPTFEATAAPGVVTFADPVLETLIRGVMGKTEGDITTTEAEAVTWLNLNIELQRYISEEVQITDLSGLENFTNLESLDLSFHAIADISPLQKLTSLTSLSLGGNPVVDITALGSLTNLKALVLSDCAAQDYTPLTNLVNLEYLMLDNSTITDLSPLVSLTNLKYLYLANSPASDYSALAEIYPNLLGKDFIVASTLEELGFVMDNARHQANYETEGTSITINHSAWGPPEREYNENIVRVSMYLEGDYMLSVGYYGVHKVYVCQMDKEGEPQMNYIYDTINGSNNFEAQDRERWEQMIRGAMDVVEGEDVLLAPIHLFDETLQRNFKMTAEALFAMPFEPPSLKSLGFVPFETNGIYLYEQRERTESTIEVNHLEQGEKDFDVHFFTPLSDEYRINVSYHISERKFIVGADDNNQGNASFEFFIDTGEHIDEWCSDPDKTVEEYFIKAYNDPAIEDVYQHSVDLMMQHIQDTFGMTIEELYALPIDN